ncbi:MAG: SDR family NAD(P)-dependent oxidoreductase [Alphaproteobacteria bacterium]
MTKELAGRVALVTGGSRGIGRAICLKLASQGADIAVNYRGNEDAAAETLAAVQALGVKARAYSASVDDFDAVAAMVAGIEKDLGPVGIMVANAGIASRGQTVADTEPAEIIKVLGTHAVGAFHAAKAVLPSMRGQERGDLIFISSVATTYMAPNGAPYNMAKAAEEALALTLAKEERRHGIFVNIVAPGLVETDMGTRLAKATRGVKDMRELDAQYPFGHVCQPDEIASMVAMLVGPGNTYATGQKVNVDGGGPGNGY